MAISKYQLKFYLTSIEPDIEQTVYSQSIGGHCAVVYDDLSASYVYPEALLSTELDASSTSANLTSIRALADPTLAGVEYLTIDGELVKVEGELVNESGGYGTASGLIRGVNGVRNVHDSGIPVRNPSRELFNEVFNEERKQYRCIAIRNNDQYNPDVPSNVKLFIKHASRNAESSIKIAVEIPRSDYKAATATSLGNSKKDVIASALTTFADNHFVDAPVHFLTGDNEGQVRIVNSFDSATGTLMLDSDLPYAVEAGDTFEILPSPAQRISSGTESPSFDNPYVSVLTNATSSSPIDFNVNGNRDHGNDFRYGDIIYVWIERSSTKAARGMTKNSATISMRYS